MGNFKRGFVSSVEEDRLGNLPEHLIALILEQLPVEDAVRTSIISKKWRYKWTTMRALVFDHHFSNKFAKNGAFSHNGFIRVINQVLFLHKGPILKFNLHIPNMFLDSFQEVDKWILFLSRNGVTELGLTNLNRSYELPSYVFSCLELTKLELYNCFFKPPLEFEGFLNLEDLKLSNINFGGGTQISLPQLKKLYLSWCTDVYNFNIKATKLQNLSVAACTDAMFLRVLDSTDFMPAVALNEPIRDFVLVEKMNLATLFSNFPGVEQFYIDNISFKFLAAEKIPKLLPCAISSLKHMQLMGFQLGDLDQLHVVLCLLRSSPNLEVLYMTEVQVEPRVDVGPASNHLESSNCLDCTLNRLQTVEIRSLEGSRPELLFIQLLLAHSPSLEKITITPSRASDLQKRLDIAKYVMQFPRASPKAKMFYLNS